jgi:hypothetical protein
VSNGKARFEGLSQADQEGVVGQVYDLCIGHLLPWSDQEWAVSSLSWSMDMRYGTQLRFTVSYGSDVIPEYGADVVVELGKVVLELRLRGVKGDVVTALVAIDRYHDIMTRASHLQVALRTLLEFEQNENGAKAFAKVASDFVTSSREQIRTGRLYKDWRRDDQQR